MVNLTFGEQVKIILSRKGMTIKQLAEEVEKHTGKPMSRQNMTQRLGRDNFQEQDMRLIAEILGCQFTLSIMEPAGSSVEEVRPEVATSEETYNSPRDITVEELSDITEEIPASVQVEVEETAAKSATEQEVLRKGVVGLYKKSLSTAETIGKAEDEQSTEPGEINPYTRKEYETNSVRMHPKKIGYIQVYDRETHQWTDMTEWAFLGYQERLKKLLGKDYKEPIYLD